MEPAVKWCILFVCTCATVALIWASYGIWRFYRDWEEGNDE